MFLILPSLRLQHWHWLSSCTSPVQEHRGGREEYGGVRGVKRRVKRNEERREEKGVRGGEREERSTRNAAVCYITLVSSNAV